ncbi:unnamed protein product [Arabis nemorensis]|uniref:AB hydrolase-1 domain-containing protein n=1 Tax=Arabis nemorensis TaxID=586526 RepID=A0A565C5C7_9BRAS|nr:unnamed protein product [Arabis nemorensis]
MPQDTWLDSKFEPYGSDNSGVAMSFGTEFLKHSLYQLSPIEDIELGLRLKRPGSLFVNDLSKRNNFSEEGYGSVRRAYIVCKEDKTIPEEHQQRMVDNYPANLVIEMEETDHMPMFSRPQLLSNHLLEIADKFA